MTTSPHHIYCEGLTEKRSWGPEGRVPEISGKAELQAPSTNSPKAPGSETHKATTASCSRSFRATKNKSDKSSLPQVMGGQRLPVRSHAPTALPSGRMSAPVQLRHQAEGGRACFAFVRMSLQERVVKTRVMLLPRLVSTLNCPNMPPQRQSV